MLGQEKLLQRSVPRQRIFQAAATMRGEGKGHLQGLGFAEEGTNISTPYDFALPKHHSFIQNIQNVGEMSPPLK